MSVPKILGVDFDETLFKHSWPDDFSEPNMPVIEYVKTRQEQGWWIILVTCRSSAEAINDAVMAARSAGIYFDGVNANHPALIDKFGDCRKIYCDEYIDDKNITIKDIEMGATTPTPRPRSSIGGINEKEVRNISRTRLPIGYRCGS